MGSYVLGSWLGMLPGEQGGSDAKGFFRGVYALGDVLGGGGGMPLLDSWLGMLPDE
jgi:hypothetical protein